MVERMKDRPWVLVEGILRDLEEGSTRSLCCHCLPDNF